MLLVEVFPGATCFDKALISDCQLVGRACHWEMGETWPWVVPALADKLFLCMTYLNRIYLAP